MTVWHSNGVFSPGESPPWPSYGGPLKLTSSLSLVKEGFSLGKLRKSSEPITAIRQATQGFGD
jgi:hypothetical protein